MTVTFDGGGGAISESLAFSVFFDIAGHQFAQEIIWLAQQSITFGCDTHRYCPNRAVTRAQMAAFLSRALQLPAAELDYFDDDDSVHQDDINRLAQSGITLGCDANSYCPHEPVTRAQMAAFLSRALQLPAAERDYFDDDDDSVHQDDINRLAQSGITLGCDANSYCPHEPVTRAQMAAFLHSVRDLVDAARSTA